jgi:hypothetical protein
MHVQTALRVRISVGWLRQRHTNRSRAAWQWFLAQDWTAISTDEFLESEQAEPQPQKQPQPQRTRDQVNGEDPVLTFAMRFLWGDKERSEYFAKFVKAAGLHRLSGHMVLCFAEIVDENVATLLAGSDVPIILRRSGDNYVYIGPAQAAGMIDGEAWEKNTDVTDLPMFVLI